MESFVREFIVWHWPILLLSGLSILILFLFFVISFSEACKTKEKKKIIRTIMIALIIVLIVVLVAFYYISYKSSFIMSLK